MTLKPKQTAAERALEGLKRELEKLYTAQNDVAQRMAAINVAIGLVRDEIEAERAAKRARKPKAAKPAEVNKAA